MSPAFTPNPLQARGIEVVIPPKQNRTALRDSDEVLYKARPLIENFFAKLKQYRAIATRHDERSANFLGGIYLAANAQNFTLPPPRE